MCYQIRDFTAAVLIRSVLFVTTKNLFQRCKSPLGWDSDLSLHSAFYCKWETSVCFAPQKFIYFYFQDGTGLLVQSQLAQG